MEPGYDGNNSDVPGKTSERQLESTVELQDDQMDIQEKDTIEPSEKDSGIKIDSESKSDADADDIIANRERVASTDEVIIRECDSITKDSEHEQNGKDYKEMNNKVNKQHFTRTAERNQSSDSIDSTGSSPQHSAEALEFIDAQSDILPIVHCSPKGTRL